MIGVLERLGFCSHNTSCHSDKKLIVVFSLLHLGLIFDLVKKNQYTFMPFYLFPIPYLYEELKN